MTQQHHNEKYLESFRPWSQVDERAFIEIKKAFDRFKKVDDRHAGALTMAWATLRTRG